MSSAVLKVIHIIKGLGRGGAEMLLLETLAKHSSRYQFGVVYFLPHKNQLVAEIEALGVPVYCLRASGIASMMFQVFALTRLLRKDRYDIIHAHLPWSGIVARLAAKLTGKKIVYTEHNNVSTYNSITRFFNKATFGLNNLTIAVSENTRQSLNNSGLGSMAIRTVLNGVNTTKYSRAAFDKLPTMRELNLPVGKTIISTVAVFRRQKRLDRWIELAAMLRKENPELYFVIVGAGPEKESLEALVKSANLGDALKFTGLLQDPRPYLACTDIYLMTSDYEGLPVALLECMSMECVPVVTAVGGIPDVVIDNVSGLVYQPEDLVSAASRILALIKDRQRMKKLSDGARDVVVERYSIERMTSELEEIYQQLAP